LVVVRICGSFKEELFYLAYAKIKLRLSLKGIYTMDFTTAVKAVFKKYTDFSTRSLRSEYWYWVLFSFLASIALSIVDSILFGSRMSVAASGPLAGLFSLLTLIPNISVATRRLHDTNKSGWWQLIALTVVGIIPLILWLCQPGTKGKNDYGDPAPKTA
jgi:uncharacterized membrane protein YhaH (DUF805 family)